MAQDHVNIGLTGEYYVLAQLAQRGLVGSLTLSNTKGVDILVTNQDLDTVFKIEVKTSNKKPARERLFGEEPFYTWTMGAKHENIIASKLFYCFVALQGPETLPRFFIVPSKEVAEYVKSQHEHWLDTRVNAVAETSMRRFRIPLSDPNGYEKRWNIFMNVND